MTITCAMPKNRSVKESNYKMFIVIWIFLKYMQNLISVENISNMEINLETGGSCTCHGHTLRNYHNLYQH